jgi:PAS domain S-box-containing protein
MTEFDQLFSSDEDSKIIPTRQKMWKVMVVDDEPDVHEVTRMALQDFSYKGMKLDIISAYSAHEGLKTLKKHTDTALIFLDVVMEEENSGLEMVKNIREQLGNNQVRIILRTGQPGAAPEQSVVIEYDINDYKTKSDFTTQKLFTSTIASLRAFEMIKRLDTSRRGLTRLNQMLEERSNEIYEKKVFLDNILHRSVNLAVIATNRNNVIKYYNPAAQQLFGYSPEEIIDLKIDDALALENITKNQFNEMIKCVERDGQYNLLIERQFKTGNKTIQARISPITDQDGLSLGLVLMGEDISAKLSSQVEITQATQISSSTPGLSKFREVIAPFEQEIAICRKNEHTLRQKVETLSKTINYTPAVLWLSDPDREQLLYISTACENILGYSQDALYLNPAIFMSNVHQEDKEMVKKAIARQATDGFDIEYRLTFPNGKVSGIWERAYPIKDESGKVFQVAGIIEDVSDWLL